MPRTTIVEMSLAEQELLLGKLRADRYCTIGGRSYIQTTEARFCSRALPAKQLDMTAAIPCASWSPLAVLCASCKCILCLSLFITLDFARAGAASSVCASFSFVNRLLRNCGRKISRSSKDRIPLFLLSLAYRLCANLSCTIVLPSILFLSYQIPIDEERLCKR